MGNLSIIEILIARKKYLEQLLEIEKDMNSFESFRERLITKSQRKLSYQSEIVKNNRKTTPEQLIAGKEAYRAEKSQFEKEMARKIDRVGMPAFMETRKKEARNISTGVEPRHL